MYSSGKQDKFIRRILHMPLTGSDMNGETQECALKRKEKRIMLHMFTYNRLKF
jgi:hypothetical protein